MKKLIRITTVPISLEKLLEDQLKYMSEFYEVTAISSGKEQLQEFGEKQGVSTFHLELTRKITPIKDLTAAIKLYKYLKLEKPQIVHSHTPKAGIIGMLASYLARVPHRLHTVAGLPLMEATGFKRQLLNVVEKLTYRCATRVYPNSQGLNDFIKLENFTVPSKLKVIGHGSSNGINTKHFDPSLFSKIDKLNLRRELNIKDDDFVFIFVGRLVSDKGINELVSAFSQISLSRNDLKLVLVGPLETELDPLLPKTLRDISENKNIISVGYQEDVRPYFAISDVLTFPSYREGFPNVVLQAGAMGLPCIVSNINGCNEIIANMENGIIIPPKSTALLSQAMIKTLEHELTFLKMKKNARIMIKDKYERVFFWEQLLSQYQLLVD